MNGVYVLVVSIGEPLCLVVGMLGRVSFRKGSYAYVGSGQIGLQKRLARHVRKNKKCFWHIDYLLDSSAARVIGVFYKEGEKSEECRLSRILGGRGVPVAGFGCSDCSCRSHLFKIRNWRFLGEFMRQLRLKDIGSVR